MITSIHTLIYPDDANATRAFLRDVLHNLYRAFIDKIAHLLRELVPCSIGSLRKTTPTIASKTRTIGAREKTV
jgi:hypothetical protein